MASNWYSEHAELPTASLLYRISEKNINQIVAVWGESKFPPTLHFTETIWQLTRYQHNPNPPSICFLFLFLSQYLEFSLTFVTN